MNTFKLTVSSPNGNLFEGDIIKLDVRGIEGDLAVMAGHVPFITTVVKAPCVITMADKSQKNAVSDGGLLMVSQTETTFLSGSFRFTE